jgi:hypothetical protein
VVPEISFFARAGTKDPRIIGKALREFKADFRGETGKKDHGN